MKSLAPYLAEAIATFMLVFAGPGAILAGADLVGVAFAHGFAIMIMVYAIGHISGAHINPAVTISMWITKKIKTAKAAGYIISQLIGASIAAYFLKVMYVNADPRLHLGTTKLAEGITFMNGIFIEAVITFMLVFVIFAVAVDKRAPVGFHGLAIGLTITTMILVTGVLTGASINPARTFGPALISGFWTNHLVYWIGPIVGGSTAALLYNKLFLKK